MNNVQRLFTNFSSLITRNSPALLTAISVAGLATTVFLTTKATFKAAELIRNYENKSNGLWIQASTKEKLTIVGKSYIPAAAVGLATGICIVGANSISSRRMAALMSVYSLTDVAFREYKDQVIEDFGKGKEEKIRTNIAQKKVLSTEGSEVIILDNGDILCYDQLTGRYFKSTMEKIRGAQNDVNQMILNGDMYASTNQFHQFLGLDATVLGEETGWAVENLLDVNFATVLTKEGVPCLSLEYRAAPRGDYFKFR